MGAVKTSLERVRELAERVASSYGLDIFDVELKREGGQQVLRVFVDRPGPAATPEDSVSIDDCARVAEDLGTLAWFLARAAGGVPYDWMLGAYFTAAALAAIVCLVTRSPRRVLLNATAMFQAGARSVDAMIEGLGLLHGRLRAEVG